MTTSITLLPSGFFLAFSSLRVSMTVRTMSVLSDG